MQIRQCSITPASLWTRLGGDEFGVLVAQNPAATDIESICHRIIESFVMPVPFNGAAVKSSASIGVAVFGDHGATLDSLYKSADLALYEAKRGGRKHVAPASRANELGRGRAGQPPHLLAAGYAPRAKVAPFAGDA